LSGILNATFRAIPTGTYFLRLRARSAEGWGIASTERFFTNVPPRNLVATVDRRTVTLSWQFDVPTTIVREFQLFVGSSPGGSDLGWYRLSGLTGNSGYYTVTFADVPIGVYFVRLTGVTGVGWYDRSAPTNEVRVITY
jgi:hypothetical protein